LRPDSRSISRGTPSHCWSICATMGSIAPSLPSPSQTPSEKSASLVALLENNGQGDYIGEKISQLEHSLQCAHRAALASATPTTTLAALFHDVGQFLPLSALPKLPSEDPDTPYGRPNHAILGATYLSTLGFSPKLCRLVAGHVPAKRYLTATDLTYRANLSEASVASLKQQGGPMTLEEVDDFEAQEGFEEILNVRRWDDEAKVVGIEDVTPRAGTYRAMIQSHLEGMVE